MVPRESAQAVENPRQPLLMQGLWLGYCKGFLEFLCLVQGAGAARVARAAGEDGDGEIAG